MNQGSPEYNPYGDDCSEHQDPKAEQEEEEEVLDLYEYHQYQLSPVWSPYRDPDQTSDVEYDPLSPAMKRRKLFGSESDTDTDNEDDKFKK